MDLLRALHKLPGLPLPLGGLTATPLAVITLLLFLWSLVTLFRQWRLGDDAGWDRGLVRLLQVTWVVFLIPAVTGLLLALSGGKVASAVDVGGGLTRYGKPFDPTQNVMHSMYTLFAFVTLLALGVLRQGTLLRGRRALLVLPVATLFLYGCAYMIGFVAVFPGRTPGE